MNRIVRKGVVTAVACAALSALGGCAGSERSTPAPETAPSVASVATVTRAPDHVGRPKRVVIPAIGVDERLHGVGLEPDGSMTMPRFGDAGWYDVGPRPGAAGPAVIVAHVHGPAGDDVFARLHELAVGDRVTVHRSDGVSTFAVDAKEQVAKKELPYERIWIETDLPVLRLITCSGEPDPVTRMYPDNTVVYAHAVG